MKLSTFKKDNELSYLFTVINNSDKKILFNTLLIIIDFLFLLLIIL